MKKQDVLAFDKGSVRSFDKDGRLHILKTPISKANICPYYGREIPKSEELGLIDDKVYFLLRDPEELAKAAATFNNLPLMGIHVPTSANDPQIMSVVGTTGTDAVFEDPYLYNSLAVWDGEAIVGVEDESKRDLSSSYHYDADMTPGEYSGQKYDGVMRNLIGNHVALVEVGRAGPDVLAADSQTQPLEPSIMKLSPTAIALRGGLKVYLRPKLANDAQIGNIRSLVSHINAANFKKQSPVLLKAIKARYEPKLAKDADLEDLSKLLEVFAQSDICEDDDMDDDMDTSMDDAADPDAPEADEPDDRAAKIAKAMAALSGLMSDEDLAKVKAMMTGTAMDDKMDPEEMRGKAAEPKAITKAAMDSMIANAKTATVKQLMAIREAEKIVQPHIGEVAQQETAAAVYKLALDAAGVDLDGVHPDAYKPIVQNLQLPGHAASKPRLSMDASSVSDFKKRYPNSKIPTRR